MEQKEEINQAIKYYAQKNGISLIGVCYQTYSMLKFPTQNFPSGKMFLSNNVRGKDKKKSIIIVAKDKNTICHMETQNVLERPLDKNIDNPMMHRFITHSYDTSVSF